jgi:hypothetical protein
MGIGLLPWDRWLPPYIYGPLVVVGSLFGLLSERQLHWWEYVLLPLGVVIGAWITWTWFRHGKNVLKDDEQGSERSRSNE